VIKAREIVSPVAAAAARSRAALPVGTDSFVSRNRRTSETLCADAGGAPISTQAMTVKSRATR
jgi:hypothetical protein